MLKKKDDENEIGQLFLKESIQLDNESVLFNENIENEVVKLFDRLKIIAKQNCVSLKDNDPSRFIIKREFRFCSGYWYWFYCVN